MKLLTICIPCYNAIEYMHKALGSCLLLKDELEVIIIDKNSTDETYEVAMEYQNEYPDTFKVIKNTENIDDIKCAYQYTTGLYFKLLNSYDWFDQASLVRVIETLKDIYSSTSKSGCFSNRLFLLLWKKTTQSKLSFAFAK